MKFVIQNIIKLVTFDFSLNSNNTHASEARPWFPFPTIHLSFFLWVVRMKSWWRHFIIVRDSMTSKMKLNTSIKKYGLNSTCICVLIFKKTSIWLLCNIYEFYRNWKVPSRMYHFIVFKFYTIRDISTLPFTQIPIQNLHLISYWY